MPIPQGRPRSSRIWACLRAHRRVPRHGDILTGLYLRLIAKRIAQVDLEFCCEQGPGNGANYARSLIGLGAIALARGNKELARRHFATGRQMAEEQQVKSLVARADYFLNA